MSADCRTHQTYNFKHPRNFALYTQDLRRFEAPAPSSAANPHRSFASPTIVTTFKQTALFFVKWALMGLGVAFAIVLVRPDILGVRGESTPASRAPVAETPRRSFADAVARAGPSVVNIYTARLVSFAVRPSAAGPLRPELPAMRRRVESSPGSGVIVDASG